MTKKLKIPKETILDVGHKVVAGALSGLPLGLGIAAATLWSFIAPPIQRRQTEFLNDVADEINKLQDKIKQLNPEELIKNEEFQTTLAKSIQVVTRTHSDEKRRILKNVVINSAFRKTQSEDEMMIFLDYIDRFSTNHIALLKLFDEPENSLKGKVEINSFSMGSISQLIEKSLNIDRDMYEQLTRDLYNAGLSRISPERLHVMMTGSGVNSSSTTNMGKRFLKYISEIEIPKTHEVT